MGADVFLSKPFKSPEILELIYEVIEKRRMNIRTKNLTIKDIKQREQEDKRIFEDEKGV